MKITPSHAKRLNFKFRTSVLGGLLLCAALSSSALTVGRMRGTAWLGQPLDVSIQVQYDETETLSAMCFDAEVFHADARQDTGRVRVSVEGTAQAQMAQVRVQSSVAVDEPVVSIYLREGCVSKSSRRYVLLTEIPGEVVPSPTLTSAPPNAPRAVSSPPATTTGTPAVAVAPRPVAAPVKPVAQSSVKIQPEATRKPVAPTPRKQPVEVKPKVAPEAAGKPQLKLDPLSSLSDRVAQLEDATLAAHSAEGDREALRLKKMEESVQALLALAAKNDRGMTELRERLQRAESEKYDNPLVYGLAALLLAALGTAAYLWRRQQGGLTAVNGWRGGRETLRAPMMPSSRTAPVAQSAPQSTPAPSVATVAPVAAVAAAVPLVETLASTAVQPVGERAGASDVDLDDLMAAMGHENASQPLSAAKPAADDFPALTLPSSAETSAPAPATDESPVVEAGAAGYHEFPAAGEVRIDVSHLSLTPVEPPVAVAPSEVLLDFDSPEFEKKETPEGKT